MVALLKAAHRLHLADGLEVVSIQEGEVAIPASLLQRGVRHASEALRVDVMQLCCMGTASTKPPSELVTGRGSAVPAGQVLCLLHVMSFTELDPAHLWLCDSCHAAGQTAHLRVCAGSTTCLGFHKVLWASAQAAWS